MPAAGTLSLRRWCSNDWPVPSGSELLASLRSITKNDKEYHGVLCKEVENFRIEYYNGKPSVSDDDYDIVYKELLQLEEKHPSFATPDSPSQSAGPPPKEGTGRQKRQHLAPMLGLNNAFNDEDLHQFDTRVTKLVQQRLEEGEKKGKSKAKAGSQASQAGRQEMVAEMKYDGIAASLVFKEGRFQYAASRGDGVIGEDFTGSFLKYVGRGVPLDDERSAVVLPPAARETAGRPGVVTEIRGELVCSVEELERVNGLLKERGEKEFSNPRSVVSGLMNRLQEAGGKGAAGGAVQPRLDMVCYSLSFYDSHAAAAAEAEARELAAKEGKAKAKAPLPPRLFLSSHWEKLATLREWGFGVCPHAAHCGSFTEALQFVHRNQSEEARKALPYAADGIVLKVNDEEVQQALGVVARASRWAVAYKFWSEKASTLLKSIVFQVGRTGKATPVAEIVPVNLGGSMIARATLHNIRFIESNSIEVGSTIVVERSGGTIPKITGLANKKPAKVYVEKQPVYTCPCSKQTTLERDKRGIDLICTSAECPKQNSRAVLHFAQCLGIKGLGGRVVDELLEYNFLCSVTDIFFLHERRAELEQIPGWGEKKAENIISQIEAGKRKATVAVVMQALGIPTIGKRLCTELFAKYQFTSVWELAECSVENLQYRGVGKAAAKKLHEFFEKRHSMELLTELSQAGLPLTRTDY